MTGVPQPAGAVPIELAGEVMPHPAGSGRARPPVVR